MQYGNVPGIAKPISRLVQGTAGAFDPSDKEQCYALLDLAVEHGFNTFDTARVYGDGREIVVGEWMRERGNRDEIVILAKGAHHGSRDGQMLHRVTPDDIKADMDKTMQNMGVDYLDLYVLHRDDPSVPVGPIVEVFNELQKAGRIGAFGGSNWTWERIQEANAYAKAHDLTPFAVSSPNFSLAEQVEEPWTNCVSISGPQGQAARDFYAREQTALFPWSSLAGGFWSDRYSRGDAGSDPTQSRDLAMRCYGYEQNFQRLDRVREMAKQKGVTVPQIALAYVMSQPLNIFALVFCGNRTEFAANVEALEIKLTPQECAWLDLRADSQEA